MCGIAGYVLRQGAADLAAVRAMCGEIRHRGPDSEGFHLEGPCALGMRRLSIIDLATGDQPMTNEDRSLWVVFNGEIYNYGELRDGLAAQGHRFTTSSDTEVLLHLYEQEGPRGATQLRGMFAYALWDSRRQRLLLVRDRFGKKPLYYAALPQGLYFASEIKSLEAAGVPREIDPEGLRLYFQFGYVPEPYTAYRDMRKLLPGCWLTCDAQGQIEHGRYWRLPVPAEQPPAGLTERDAADRLRDLFDESVRLRLVADVPLGAFLSGGIDSSLVVASMALQTREPVKTFSIGFEEARYNELGYARMVAERYHTDHREIVVRPDALALTQKLVRQFDEPFADSSAIPTYIVSEFAARHVKVALSGDGGDELFAGYESFPIAQKLPAWDRLPGLLRACLGRLAQWLPYSAYGKNYLYMISRPTALERYFQINYAPYLLRRELLEPEWMLPPGAGFLRRTFADCLPPENAGVLTQALYFEATAKLTGDMLVKVDRMSMAASLEVRCPLLDHRLAEFAATLPHAWKLRDGRGKYILLRSMGDRLPPALLNRPKMGFAIPLAEWLNGPLRDLLHDHLRSPAFLGRGIVSPRFVERLLAEHASGRRDNHTWLWMLLVLAMWFQEVERPMVPAPLAA